MSITHATSIRTTICDDVVLAVDAGGGAGKIRFYTASYSAPLCDITLSATSFGGAVSGTATLAGGALEGTCYAGGTAAVFRFMDFAETVIFSGTVGTSGQDINFNSVTWYTNDVVRLTGLTYSSAA